MISAFPVTALEYLYHFLWVISWAAISSLKCYSRWFVQKVSEGKYHLLKAYQVSLVLVLFLSLNGWKPVHCVLNHRAVIWRCSNVAYIPLRRKKLSTTSISHICSLYKVVQNYWLTGDTWLQFTTSNFVKIFTKKQAF